MLPLSVLLFFVLQVGSGLFYKWGADRPGCGWLGFVLGNALGITSTYFLMRVYGRINPNVGEAICRGGYFILIQIAFMVVFHSRLSGIQWIGIALIVSGIAMVSLCRAGS